MNQTVAHVMRIQEHGKPDVMHLAEVDIPLPSPGEVTVRQRAMGVNFVDTMFRDGSYKVEFPAVMGIEAAGVVEQVGASVEGFKVGDRVAYFYIPGAYATVRNVPAARLVKLPDDITFEQAATFFAKGITSWMGLRLLFHVGPGQTVLVQGAAGAVGSIVTRWARALGAKVIGTTGSEGKLSSIAADHALLSTAADFDAQVRALAPEGVDLVIELVGASTIEKSVRALKDGGTLLNIGAASGAATLNPVEVKRRRLKIDGGSSVRAVKGELIALAAADIFNAVRDGFFADLAPTRYALSEAVRVHEDIASRRLAGPAVLLP